MINFLIKFMLFVIPLIILLFVDVDYSIFSNIDNILLGSIALSSASLGFFIAGVSILQTSNLSRFYKTLTELGTDKKIMSWLMASITYMFFLSSLSLIALFLVGDINKYKFVMDVWLSLLSASLLSTSFIIIIFGMVFTKK